MAHLSRNPVLKHIWFTSFYTGRQKFTQRRRVEPFHKKYGLADAKRLAAEE